MESDAGTAGALLKGLQLYALQITNVKSIAWAPDGRMLATASDDGWQIWSSTDGRKLRSRAYDKADAGLIQIAWSPDGRTLATVSKGGTWNLWDAFSGDELLSKPSDDGVKSLSWAPNGSWLATSGENGTWKLWDST